MNIYVGNLLHQTTDEDLRKAYETFGQVESTNIIKDRFSISLFVIWLCIIGLTTAAAGSKYAENKKAYVPFEVAAEKYEQQFVATFKNEDTAKKASIDMEPLYNGYIWAVSSRWDDNNKNDLKMRDVLEKHGHKTTWYLNSPGGFISTGIELLKGGNSIGGHSLSHPFITYVNRNRMFEEIAGIRAEWEAAADTLVVSYAFSFCDFRIPNEAGRVHADITRALNRAGFYNIANGWYHDQLQTDMILSPIMPWDGQDIDEFAEAALKSETFGKEHPNLSYSMHTWYKTPQAWARFEDQLDKYANNPNWWYCNQNQYAAYRYQYLHSKLYPPQRNGNTIRLRIKRPKLLDLNDPVPLTFRIKAVLPEDVISVKCRTADCVLSERKTDGFVFHLYHNRKRALPGKIGIIRNKNNRAAITDTDQDVDFPGLRALLSFHNQQLHLTIDNRSKIPLENIRVTYRLPLAWKQGVVYQRIKDIRPGTNREEKLTARLLHKGYKYNAGISYFLAQIDFILADLPGRLYSTCHVRNDVTDRSYPQGRFLKLGPVYERQLDIEKLVSQIKVGEISTEPWRYSWQLPNDTILHWSADKKDSPLQNPYLDVEVIGTTGRWRCEKHLLYVLQTSLLSDCAQPVKFRYEKSIQDIFLNGCAVTNDTAQLDKGDNSLVLIYNNRHYTRKYNAEFAGCFLRLVNPDTGNRLKNTRFQPENVKLQRHPAFKVPRL